MSDFSPPDGFRLVSTPNPSEIAIAVTIPQEKLIPGRMPQPYIPARGASAAIPATTYGLFDLSERFRSQEFGNYCFTASEAGDGETTFYFAAPRTQAQRMTPYRTTQWMGNHPWPPVLKQIYFERDAVLGTAAAGADASGNPANITGPRYYPRYVFIPPVNEGTLFIKEEFTSEIPFTIGRYPVPMPQEVNFSNPTTNGSFPECLHETITFDDMLTATAAVSGSGVSQVIGAINGQTFPKTNFKRWMQYILSFDQQPPGVVYTAVRILVCPPPEPKTIVR